MNKVDIETANTEFDRFADEMDLDLDVSAMDQEDLTSFNKMRNRLIRSMQRGDLVINESGEAVFTPSRPGSKYKEAITFHERTGASLMAMDGKKRGHDVAKTYAIMGDMCGIHPKSFAMLAGSDIKICESIFALLMD